MGGRRKLRNFATFRLFPRAGAVDPSDRVFVRVDNNPYCVPGFDAAAAADALAAPDEHIPSTGGPLPEHVRREILELGLPDDGYNYLLHLRELRPSVSSTGGGTSAANQHNRSESLPLDVKAYDATRVRIASDKVADELDEGRTICKVAEKTAAVRRIEKAVDPDVARLLEENDVSLGGSDDDGLEEDFVIMANHHEGAVEVEEEEDNAVFSDLDDEVEDEEDGGRKERVRRLLDEQFDQLALEEYADSEDDDDGVRDSAHELPPKVIDELKVFHSENVDADEEYRTPADFVHRKQESSTMEEVDESVHVIQKCAEYVERYLNESAEEEQVVLVPESSDESEIWDCETIVSTYSNLDNHPGKIEARQNPRRQLPKLFPGETAALEDIIKLHGKEKLPVDYLPQRKRNAQKEKKTKSTETSLSENLKRRAPNESKEEKKERKAAVKEEKREARRAKKELKCMYKSETQKGQKAAAVTGPSSIRLM